MASGPHHGVQLWQDAKEREQYENFAELYAIIKTTERLEKAYVKDMISAKEYEPACAKLIGQFRTLRTAVRDVVPDVERFMSAYRMDCPAAKNRLLVAGVPATVEHKAATTEGSNTTVAVAETVQNFITAMDTVKLNMLAVDQVHPLLSSLLGSLSSVPLLPPNFEGTSKVKDWLARLNGLPASAELSESEARQLSFDLESSYSGFMHSLGIKN